MKKVIVVGGGISGLCSAYYLVKDGHKVTILDQTNMDSGTSYINAGYITPSHFVPLAAPGIITQGLKWMLNSSSPFYMKPRWDMDFFKWALLFKKSAAVSNLERALPVLKELNLKSRALYEELLASHEFDFHYERKGVLMAYCSENTINLIEVVDALQNRVGRIIYNGVPTGVEVCPSMQHGGPYPASTDSRFTAVGVHAINRWVRPVSYQSFPQSLLPEHLKG